MHRNDVILTDIQKFFGIPIYSDLVLELCALFVLI